MIAQFRRRRQQVCCAGVLLCAAWLTGCGSSPTPTGPGGAGASNYQLALDADAPKRQLDSVGLFFCLDVSGSMEDSVGGKRKIEISKDAMRKVFAQIAAYQKSHPERRVLVGLCAFSGDARVVLPLAPFNPSALEQQLGKLRTGGGTAIGDAIALAMQQLHESAAETRAIIVMTDGENNKGAAPHEVVQAIRDNKNSRNATTGDTAMHLVAFDVDSKVFQQVKQSGAAVVESRDARSLQTMLDNIVEEVLLEK